MLKTISQIGKTVRSDIIFIIVTHLLLLSLYVFAYYKLSYFSATSKPQ